MTKPTETERLALRYDPFQGEDIRRRTMVDGIVVTRKPHDCIICLEPIPLGARARSTTEIMIDGQHRTVMTFHTCPTCVEAEAASWTDAGKAICARTSIGISNADGRRRHHG